MASGKHHVLTSLVLSPVAAGAAWILTEGNAINTLLVGLGCLSGVIISPDLDLSTRTISKGAVLRQSLGLGYLWITIWYPYGKLFKHRGLSHAPVLGTLTRIIYLFIVAFLVQLAVQYFNHPNFTLEPYIFAYWPAIVLFVSGLLVSDLGHWLLDFVK
jgi:uncharacterized metal-binding protein